MDHTVIAALPTSIRPLVETQLPGWLQVRWFSGKDEALAAGPGAEIGWFDLWEKQDMAAAVINASSMQWLNSMITGMDGLPLQTLRQRQVRVTNGAGINAITVAEYVLMGMLTIAKGYRDGAAAPRAPAVEPGQRAYHHASVRPFADLHV